MERKHIDWEKLDLVLQYKPSLEDAAELCGCGATKLSEAIREEHGVTFREYRNKKMAKTRIGLVQKALNMANNGNSALMIFALKNLCGWTDKMDTSDNSKNDKKLVIKLVDEDDT